MILTKELCDKRAEAREAFPNYEYLPGDTPPIGRSVLTSNLREAIILGEYPGTRDGELKNWWLLKTKDGHVILEWPPSLHSIK